jgi:hypothetical protein
MNPVISVSFYLSVQLLTMLAVSDGIRTLLPPGLGRKLALAAILTAYAACMALPVAGTFLPAGRLKFAVQGAGDIWLGFYIFFMESLFVFYVPWAIIRLITKKPAGRSSGIILLLAAAAGFVILICGMAHAQNTPVTRY